MKNVSIYIKYSLASLMALAMIMIRPDMIQAVTTPAFPSCPNPGGTQIAGYETGVHGIPGDSATHTGSDYVYQLNDTQVVQCFCPDSGSNGIKTDWLKIGNLSEDDLSILIKQGWTWIPTGSAWGLNDGPYLAYNSNMSCGGTGGGSNSSSSSNSTDSSSSSSNSSGIGGSVLGIATLANTGLATAWVGLGLLAALYYAGIKTILSPTE